MRFSLHNKGKIAQFEELYEEEIFKTAKGKSIRVKNNGAKKIYSCDEEE